MKRAMVWPLFSWKRVICDCKEMIRKSCSLSEPQNKTNIFHMRRGGEENIDI